MVIALQLVLLLLVQAVYSQYYLQFQSPMTYFSPADPSLTMDTLGTPVLLGSKVYFPAIDTSRTLHLLSYSWAPSNPSPRFSRQPSKTLSLCQGGGTCKAASLLSFTQNQIVFALVTGSNDGKNFYRADFGNMAIISRANPEDVLMQGLTTTPSEAFVISVPRLSYFNPTDMSLVSTATGPERLHQFRFPGCLDNQSCFFVDKDPLAVRLFKATISGSSTVSAQLVSSHNRNQEASTLLVSRTTRMVIACSVKFCHFFNAALGQSCKDLNLSSSLDIQFSSINPIDEDGKGYFMIAGLNSNLGGQYQTVIYRLDPSSTTNPYQVQTRLTNSAFPIHLQLISGHSLLMADLSIASDKKLQIFDKAGQCYGSCTKCQGPASHECIGCDTNYFDGNTCQACNSECLSCLQFASDCTSCVSGKTLQPSGSYSTCVDACDSPKIINSFQECLSCEPECLTCSGSSQNCLTCKNGGKLLQPENTCVACGDGYFAEGNLCHRCFPGCAKCTGKLETDCIQCVTGFYYYAATKKCDFCEDGHYKSGTNCLDCHPTCLRCTDGASTSCTKCKPGFQLSSGSCIPCPSATFYDGITQTCKTCDNACLTCDKAGPKGCKTCKNNKVPAASDNTCLACDNASGNYVYNSLCYPCNSACKTCSAAGTTSCLSCPTNKYLLTPGGSCTSCGVGFYKVGTACYACDSSCLECSGAGASKCTKCAATKFLLSPDNTCGECGSGFYSVGTNCYRCDSSCAKCSGPGPSACTACPPSKYILEGQGSCVDCGVGFYIIFTDCYKCDPNCSTCSGMGSCTGCIPGYGLDGGKCLPCGSGFFSKNDLCFPCDSTCKECTMGGPNGCSSCRPGSYKSETSSCLPCDLSCLECTGAGPSHCSKCASPKVLSPSFSCIEDITTPTSNQKIPITLTVQHKIDSSQASVPALSITFSIKIHTPESLITQDNILNLLFQSLSLNFRSQSSSIKPFCRLSKGYSYKSHILISTYTLCDSLLSESRLSLLLSVPEEQIITIGSFFYAVQPVIYPVQLDNPFYEVSKKTTQNDQKVAEVVGRTVGVEVTQNESISQEILTWIAAFDPSGMMIKLVQTIKILNRLYFLNVNYGSRLTTFMKTIEHHSGTVAEPSDDFFVKKMPVYRFRLSQHKLLGQFLLGFHWKTGFYLLLWLLKWTSWFLISKQVAVSRKILIFLYYLPRLHLIFFNYILVDFTFYLVRAKAHVKDSLESLTGSLILCLLIMDLLHYVNMCLRNGTWLRAIRILKGHIGTPRHLKGFQGPVKKTNLGLPILGRTKNSGTKISLPRNLVINYPATYANIRNNVGLVPTLAGTVKESLACYRARINRYFFVLHATKIFVFQVIIVGAQTCPVLGISILILTELFMAGFLFGVQKLHKPLKSSLFFGVELLQHILMIVFLGLTLNFALKTEGKRSLSAQLLGIIALCGACLLNLAVVLVLLIINLVQFFKERRTKKRKKLTFTWFICMQAVTSERSHPKTNQVGHKLCKSNMRISLKSLSGVKRPSGLLQTRFTSRQPGSTIKHTRYSSGMSSSSCKKVTETKQNKLTKNGNFIFMKGSSIFSRIPGSERGGSFSSGSFERPKIDKKISNFASEKNNKLNRSQVQSSTRYFSRTSKEN